MVRFRSPRLRKDWSDVDSIEESVGTTSQELFWNSIFSTALVSVGTMIVRGKILTSILAFEAFFHVWEASALYATRFNDDDAYHRIFWGVFGSATIVMLGACRLEVGVNGWALFPAATAGAKLCLAISTARVGFVIPRCRKYTNFVAAQHFIQALAFIYIAIQTDAMSTKKIIIKKYWLFANVLGLVFDFIFILVSEFVSGMDLPLSIEYHSAKYQGFHTLVLGAAVALTASSSTAQIQNDAYVRATLLSTATIIVFILAYKQILVDAAPKPHRHALHSKNRLCRLTWLFLQRILIASIVCLGAGAQILVAAWNYEPQGTYLMCIAAAVMYILLPALRSLDAEKLDPRAAAVPILAATFLTLLPFCQPPPFIVTSLIAVSALFVVLATPDDTSNPPLLRYYSSQRALSSVVGDSTNSQHQSAASVSTRLLEISQSPLGRKQVQYDSPSALSTPHTTPTSGIVPRTEPTNIGAELAAALSPLATSLSLWRGVVDKNNNDGATTTANNEDDAETTTKK
mmetsp:Transcript_18565/g.22518  ORF Transcript_18565/g.22518 Transcript_18565/m.22518 type:complete len:516 (+) Transcript_18565:38-1585(+)